MQHDEHCVILWKEQWSENLQKVEDTNLHENNGYEALKRTTEDRSTRRKSELNKKVQKTYGTTDNGRRRRKLDSAIKHYAFPKKEYSLSFEYMELISF